VIILSNIKLFFIKLHAFSYHRKNIMKDI